MSPFLVRHPRLIMVQGELSGTTHEALEAVFDEHMPAPGEDLILDLTHVSFIDGAGLRLLVRCLRRVAAGGGALAIAGLRPEPATIFELLGATDMFACYPDTTAAARAIARRRKWPTA